MAAPAVYGFSPATAFGNVITGVFTQLVLPVLMRASRGTGREADYLAASLRYFAGARDPATLRSVTLNPAWAMPDLASVLQRVQRYPDLAAQVPTLLAPVVNTQTYQGTSIVQPSGFYWPGGQRAGSPEQNWRQGLTDPVYYATPTGWRQQQMISPLKPLVDLPAPAPIPLALLALWNPSQQSTAGTTIQSATPIGVAYFQAGLRDPAFAAGSPVGTGLPATPKQRRWVGPAAWGAFTGFDYGRALAALNSGGSLAWR